MLTVEDDAEVRRWISALLGRLGVEVVEAASGAEAIAAAGEGAFDLVLLDVQLPDMSGYDVADALRLTPDAPEAGVPILFLTGSDGSEDKLRAFRSGAVDYVVKPFEPEELLARVRAVLRRRSLLDQLERQAATDALTGLLNRQALQEELESAARSHTEAGCGGFAVVFIDVDRFKSINDSLGHAWGDRVLRRIAATLSEAVAGASRPASASVQHAVARNGGDEFVLLLHGFPSARACVDFVGDVVEAAAKPFDAAGHRLRVGLSAGVRWCDQPGVGVEVMLRDADAAMYEAKRAGRGRVVLFEASMHRDELARLQLENELRAALVGDQFLLHYQPLVAVEDDRLTHFEALVRWQHPERGLLQPADFVSQAEDSGLIGPLGERVIEQACRQLAAWIERFGEQLAPPIHVNVSAEQLHHGDIEAHLRACLDEHGVPASKIGIEVTESSLMLDAERASEVLGRLKKLGVTLSIDDFGTGYSSLSTLRSFPFDVIKIDRSFVMTMSLDRSKGGVIHAIVNLAWNLGMKVVAEGVETAADLVQLVSLEVDLLQGYFLSRPVPPEAAEAMIRDRGEPFLLLDAEGSARSSAS